MLEWRADWGINRETKPEVTEQRAEEVETATEKILYEKMLAEISIIINKFFESQEPKIDTKQFNNSIETILIRLTELCLLFEVDYQSWLSSELILMALSLVDLLIEFETRDVEGLVNRTISQFLYLCIIPNEKNEFYQLSKVVKNREIVTEYGEIEYSLFDPDNQELTLYEKKYFAVKELISKFKDEHRSEFVNKYKERIFPRLKDLFDRVNDLKSDDTIEIVVLSISEKEFIELEVEGEKLNAKAYIIQDKNQKSRYKIVVCYDSSCLEGTLHHEYNHYISNKVNGRLAWGYKNLAGRGIDEAVTEMLTHRPITYWEQRFVLDLIIMEYPMFQDYFRQVYFGEMDQNDQNEQFLHQSLESKVFNYFGPLGLINLKFMSSSSHELQDELGKTILISPQDCIEFFAEQCQNNKFIDFVDKVSQYQSQVNRICNGFSNKLAQIVFDEDRRLRYFQVVNELNKYSKLLDRLFTLQNFILLDYLITNLTPDSLMTTIFVDLGFITCIDISTPPSDSIIQEFRQRVNSTDAIVKQVQIYYQNYQEKYFDNPLYESSEQREEENYKLPITSQDIEHLQILVRKYKEGKTKE